MRFLIIDDDPDKCFLNEHALKRAFPCCAVVTAHTAAQAFEEVSKERFDGVLADHHMQGDEGDLCIRELRERDVRCHIVLVTNSSNPAVAERALLAGADHVCPPESPDFVGYLQRCFAQ